MGNWVRKSISLIGQVVSGATPSTSNSEFWNGGIIWITPTDLSKNYTPYIQDSERKISKAGLQNCSAFLVPAGNLVLSSRAPIGYFAIVENNFTTNQGCKSVIFHKDQNPIYHYYNFLYNVNQFKEKGEGTTFAEISKSAIEKLEFFVSEDYHEQTTIATILTTIDQAIEKTEQLIAKYERIKTGLMQDLLTRGIDEQGNIRSEETHEFKDSLLGRIPKEWDCCTFKDLISQGEVLEIQDGNHGELHPKTKDFIDEGIPFVMASDISKGKIDIINCKKISKIQYSKLRIGFSKPGDVLLSHKASIGFTAIVPFDLPEIMLTPQVTYYRLKKEGKINNTYLHSFFQSTKFQVLLGNLAKQSTRDYIGITAQKELTISFPNNLEEQKIISEKIKIISDSIFDQRKSYINLIYLKSGLMQDLLTGKVRVDNLIN